MTTKEFQRRCVSFSSLDKAAFYFLNSDVNAIWRITLIYISGTPFISYCTHTSVSDQDSNFCLNVWFDLFKRSDFLIQLKFFNSFLSRLSNNQFYIIHSDNRFTNLFNFIENDKSCSSSEK